MLPFTKSINNAPIVEKCRVLDVNISTYTVTISTEFSKKIAEGVSFATPYQHYSNGEGIYFMPEVGSICWVCWPSDGNMPFVLAWGSAQKGANYKAYKKDLNPGDIYLGTRDENFIWIRRGGVLQVGATPLAQRIYFPINNIIKDFCENYSLQTLSGSLDWTLKLEEDSQDANRPCLFKLSAKDKAKDEKPIAVLEMGHHDDGSVIDLKVMASGSVGATVNVKVKVFNNGNISFSIEGNYVIEIKGELNISTDQNISVESKQAVTMSAQTNMELGAQTDMTVKSGGLTTVKAGTILSLKAPLIKAGGESAIYPVLVASPAMLAYITGHTHMTIAIGSATTPPITPVAAQHVSTVLFAKS